MDPPGWSPTKARVWIVRYAYERALREQQVAALVRAADEHKVDSVEGFRETLVTVLGWRSHSVDWAVQEATRVAV